MTVYISELLKGIAKAKTRKEKKTLLEQYKTNNIFKFVLQGTFDPSIVWNVPKKMPPYKKDDAPIGLSETSLFTVMPKCSMFVKGHPKSEKLKTKRIKELLIQILESMHPDESLIFEQMLKKKLKVKGLTEKLVLEVFPDLYRKVDK
jgi:Na+-transporting NADH:ubiquinone oxidoreductase subunit NqrF